MIEASIGDIIEAYSEDQKIALYWAVGCVADLDKLFGWRHPAALNEYERMDCLQKKAFLYCIKEAAADAFLKIDPERYLRPVAFKSGHDCSDCKYKDLAFYESPCMDKCRYMRHLNLYTRWEAEKK